METYINVEPCDLIQIISKIKITVLNINLNESAVIQCECFSDDNKFLVSYIYELRQPEYSEWYNDYWLINYTMEKYGFTMKNNVSI